MRRRLAAGLAALILLAAGCGADDRGLSAADQVPALATTLERVDAALASQSFGAARRHLRALKAAVLEARDAGDLREADARRVLDAIKRLMATIPAGPSPAPTSEGPSPSATPRPARPSESGSPSRPEKSEDPESTPVAPSDTAAPTTTPTPTGSPSAEPSPSGSASAMATPTS